jgi:uncharacterized protein YbjT (DUF2867 family)
MYVLVGATGNVGRVTAEKLLGRGQKVRVIGREAKKLERFVQNGAEAFAADVLDTDALARAFTGARAVFTMNPPAYQLDKYREYMERVSDSLAAAIRQAGVTHVVNLSSIGAHLAEPPGPIAGLRSQEQKLNAIAGLNVLHLRPGFFMENNLSQLQIIKMFGMTAGGFRGDVALQQIATRDIGAAAAEELEKQAFTGQQTRELLGQRDISMNETARVIGQAIGKPGLTYMQAPDSQLVFGMTQMGFSESTARLVLEMSKAANEGGLRGAEARTPGNTTPTSMETFAAEEFAPRYQGKSAGA